MGVPADFMKPCTTLKLGCSHLFRYLTTYRLRLEFSLGTTTLSLYLGRMANQAAILDSLIVESLGFTRFQTTLLGTLDGVIESTFRVKLFPFIYFNEDSLYYYSHHYLHRGQTSRVFRRRSCLCRIRIHGVGCARRHFGYYVTVV